MKTLTLWAVRLYPAAWRERYGEEMALLVEDSGGGDLWDVVRGAMTMQMTSLSFWKVLMACSLAGALASGFWAASVPKRYVSTAVLNLTVAEPPEKPVDAGSNATRRLHEVELAALSKPALSDMVSRLGLYTSERGTRPMDVVVAQMCRRDLRVSEIEGRRTANCEPPPGGGGRGPLISARSSQAFMVQFTSDDPGAARAAVQAVAAAITEQNARTAAGEGQSVRLDVLDPPSLPRSPLSPNWLAAAGAGLAAGLLLGVVCGGTLVLVRRKNAWNARRIGVFAAAGLAAGVGVAFLMPGRYVSTAVVRTADRFAFERAVTDAMNYDSLSAIVRREPVLARESKGADLPKFTSALRNRRFQVIRLEESASEPAAVFTIRFTASDRFAAQRVNQAVISRIRGELPQATEVLDAPSAPAWPVWPNRPLVACFGAVAGLLLGAGSTLLHRPKPVSA